MAGDLLARGLGRAVLAGVVALVAACGTSREGSKPAELADFKPSLIVRSAWRVDAGRARGAPLQPAVLENAIFTAAADGTVLRVAPATGRVEWRVDAGAPLSAGVGSDGFVIAVGTPRGEVLAFGADGKPLWRAQASSDIQAPPLVGRGLVIVRSTDHRVTAYEADSGKRRWSFARTPPPLTLRAPSDMAFAGDNVVIGLPGGRLVAVALSNGAARWEAAVSESKGTTEVERLADVIGALAVDARDVCAAAFQGRITCVDAGNGNLRWSRDLAAGAGVALDARQAYAVDAGGTVAAFAREGGASVWRNTQLANRRPSSPLALPSAVVVGDFAGFVHFLQPADGSFAARVTLDGSAIAATPRPWADGVVVLTQDGTLALLTVER